MFNTPILDVALGLVFIFLVYSLLATSIKEGIATVFALRARMLKTGIVENMLSDTPKYGKLESIWVSIRNTIDEILHFITGHKPLENIRYRGKQKPLKLGELFYDHPIIKNYGSSRLFPNPSYIAPDNFSMVLVEVLKNDFTDKIEKETLVNWYIARSGKDANRDDVKMQLIYSSDAVKLKVLLEYYIAYHNDPVKNSITNPVIDKETAQILYMLLERSSYITADFSKQLQNWFNDSMDRVTGWYRRQSQIMLFFIGIVVAIGLNVDTLEMSQKLSKDKTLREQMVQLAIKSADKYKNDKMATGSNMQINDSNQLKAQYHYFDSTMQEAKKVLNSDASDITQIMALGWGNYGGADSLQVLNTLNFPPQQQSPGLSEAYKTAEKNYYDILQKKKDEANQKLVEINQKLTTLTRWYRHIDSIRITRTYDSVLKKSAWHILNHDSVTLKNPAEIEKNIAALSATADMIEASKPDYDDSDQVAIVYKKLEKLYDTAGLIPRLDLLQRWQRYPTIKQLRDTLSSLHHIDTAILNNADSLRHKIIKVEAHINTLRTGIDTMETIRRRAWHIYYNDHWFCLSLQNACLKLHYMFSHSWGRKIIGFMLTAFALSLGAPFWFDSLNKIISLRGANKSDGGTKNAEDKDKNKDGTNANIPVQVTVNNHNPGEEAVG